MVAWAWGINGALSVLGATLAIFIAMNWGFRMTLLSASATYLVGLIAFCPRRAISPRPIDLASYNVLALAATLTRLNPENDCSCV